MTVTSHVSRLVAFVFLALAITASAAPTRDWDWHMPGSIYKELDFTDRAGVERAVLLFQRAIDAENSGKRVTDLVPMYRAAAGEWRKVQVQAETAGGNESLLAYAVFMQGYARQQAHDRNESIKLFNEVLDLYPEEKYIAVPARYMIAIVKRELGDNKQADAELEAIVEDGAAEGHVLYYNVLRDLAGIRWSQGRVDDAADLWAKIFFSKAKVDQNVRNSARDNLIVARVVSMDFAGLKEVLDAGKDKATAKRDALVGNAGWIADIDAYWHHGVTQYLDRKYPRDKKAHERKTALEKLRKQYISWFEQEIGQYPAIDDGWTLALLRLRLYRPIENKDQIQKRVNDLMAMVKNAKPDALSGRARSLAFLLLGFDMKEEARIAAALPKDVLYRLHLQYEIEDRLQQWKSAVMYLEQYIGSKPPPSEGDLKAAKYDLAFYCRHRLGTPDRAIKIYMELNDPPRTLWLLAETYRDIGKKKESYTTLTEIASIFPNDAPNAVLRMAQWKEADGDKKAAIGLYRQLMNHPKWKQTGASSAAHQALERLGVATGGAMTNEVR